MYVLRYVHIKYMYVYIYKYNCIYVLDCIGWSIGQFPPSTNHFRIPRSIPGNRG